MEEDCLDNDTSRFAWADEVNGKGVIYRMIDEFNNDVPYDFKNIQFERDGSSFYEYYFTFTWINEDDTIWDASVHPELTDDAGEGSRVFSNIMSSAKDYLYILNDNVFIADYDDEYGIFYGWYSNTIKDNFVGNTIGDNFSNNVIGSWFRYNTIGYGFYNNIIGYGFRNNAVGSNFDSNTIGDYFDYNTVGDSFSDNTIGDGFSDNTVGYGFRDNTIGNDFLDNTVGNGFSDNTIGNYFCNNTVGDSFSDNTIGNDFRNNAIGNIFYSNTVGNSVEYVHFSLHGSFVNPIRYLYLKDGLRGASSINRLDLYYDGLYGRDYSTTFEVIANGNIISSWEAAPLTRAGKVKATNTTATWSDI